MYNQTQCTYRNNCNKTVVWGKFKHMIYVLTYILIKRYKISCTEFMENKTPESRVGGWKLYSINNFRTMSQEAVSNDLYSLVSDAGTARSLDEGTEQTTTGKQYNCSDIMYRAR